MNIPEIKAQRAKLIGDCRALVELAEKEKRDLSADEQAQVDLQMEQADDLERQADTLERKQRIDNAEQGLKVSTRKVAATVQPSRDRKEDRERMPEIIRAWALHGSSHASPSPEVFRSAENLGINLAGSTLTFELRSQVKSTTTAGGFTVPTDFGDRIVEHLRYYCPVRNYCTVVNTDNGQSLPFPTNDDTGNVGAIIAEAGTISEVDTVFGQKSLGAYKYQSMCRLSTELLTDSKFDLSAYLSRKLGERIARGQEVDFMIGDGSSKPWGLVSSATGSVASWTTTYANLLTLFYSVDRAYRQKGVWVMSDTTLGAIHALVDDNSRPLIELERPLDQGPFESLFTRPIVVSNSMLSSGTTKKVIVFGCLDDFMIRDVGSVTLLRSDHRWIDQGLVGFIATLRSDSNFFGPTSALKCGITA